MSGNLCVTSTENNNTRDNAKLYAEMQIQLGNAETRCTTLKQKLDQVKKVCQENSMDSASSYNANNNNNNNNNNSSRFIIKHAGGVISAPTRSDESVPPFDAVNNNLTDPNDDSVSRMFERAQQQQQQQRSIGIPRQNSQAIFTDKPGAAVKAINNILSGITESVNRLSEIDNQQQLQEEQQQRNNNQSRPNSKMMNIECKKKSSTTQTQTHFNANGQNEEGGVINNEESTCVVNVNQRKRARKKHASDKYGGGSGCSKTGGKVELSSANISLHSKKSIRSTAKHSEKRLKLTANIRPAVETGSSSSHTRRHMKNNNISRRINKERHGVNSKNNNSFLERSFYTDNLVELYHNSAVNAHGSDSDNENNQQQQQHITVVSKKVKKLPLVNQQTSSVLPIPPLEIHEISGDNEFESKLSPIQERGEFMVNTPAAPRTDYSACTKNYELPTIASKMKQVCKSYLRSFDFRAIPFCAAKSTSPSHNIGINIQQVMNIIKTRQPISGISPTLAHNIGLAAEKLNSRPLSALVSSLGSRITYSRPICPLTKHQLNYQQLQEMAKEIPEEEINDCMLQMQCNNIASNNNGASGDMEEPTMWTVDPSEQRTCICYSQQGLGFQQVFSRYQSKMSARAINSQAHYKINTTRYRMPKYLQRYTVPPKQRRSIQQMCSSADGGENNIDGNMPLKGKERSLKGVLKHLHDDFEQLNQRYEELSRRLNDGEELPENNLKELETLEKDLSHKEEEINMVMALYREVVSLKEQVKCLKERASLQSVSMSPTPRFSKMNAACNLTKILRQLQFYKDAVKKEGRY